MAGSHALTRVDLYTDGACLGNPGPGGFGIVLLCDAERTERSGGFRLTTNNRMEIFAAISGLQMLEQRCKVTLYSDSRYLVDGMVKGWARRWRANGWMRGREGRAANADLWETLLDFCAWHEVRFEWIRGHTGDRENERCDGLSVSAAQQEGLPEDTGYERPEPVRTAGQLSLDL